MLLIPERGNLIGGGKDGILYNLDKNNLGKDTWNPQFNLPFVATYLPNPPTNGAGLPTTTVTNPNWPIVNRDRNLPAQTPAGKSYHIHGTPVYLERAAGGIVFLWGENERLKGYNFNFATKRITAFRAQGTQIASGNMAAPGGMPGGRLVVSSNGTTPGTGVVWGVYPTEGNANAAVVHGALVAYDATTVLNGNRLKQLFHSDTDPANSMGNFAKYSTPVVANGKVYVGTFSNKVVQYGLAPGLRTAKPAARRRRIGSARSCRGAHGIHDDQSERPRCDDLWLSRGRLECRGTRGLQSAVTGKLSILVFQNHSDSHHGSYEVHFKSNYQGEPDLKYCVAIYCQQGWDPTTTKTSVTLMGARAQSARGAGHGGECGVRPAAGTGRRKAVGGSSSSLPNISLCASRYDLSAPAPSCSSARPMYPSGRTRYMASRWSPARRHSSRQWNTCSGSDRSLQTACISRVASPYTWTCQSSDASGAKLSLPFKAEATHGSRSPPCTAPARPSLMLLPR